MKPLTRLGAAAAAALLSLTLSAGALPIGLTQVDAPAVSGGGGLLVNGPLGPGLTFSGPGVGSAPAAASDLFVSVTTGPGFTTGAFNVSSPSTGQYLVGNLVDFGFLFDAAGADRLELLFDITGGSAAPEFGSQALAFLTGEFGTNDGAFSTGFAASADIRIAAPPIPLPAAPILLLSGLAVFGVFRHRKHASG
jgi:hypothetical protein